MPHDSSTSNPDADWVFFPDNKTCLFYGSAPLPLLVYILSLSSALAGAGNCRVTSHSWNFWQTVKDLTIAKWLCGGKAWHTIALTGCTWKNNLSLSNQSQLYEPLLPPSKWESSWKAIELSMLQTSYVNFSREYFSYVNSPECVTDLCLFSIEEMCYFHFEV